MLCYFKVITNIVFILFSQYNFLFVAFVLLSIPNPLFPCIRSISQFKEFFLLKKKKKERNKNVDKENQSPLEETKTHMNGQNLCNDYQDSNCLKKKWASFPHSASKIYNSCKTRDSFKDINQ